MIKPVNRTPAINQRLMDENKIHLVSVLYEHLYSEALLNIIRDSRYKQAVSERDAAHCHVDSFPHQPELAG